MERIYQKIGKIKEYLLVIRSIKDDCMSRFNTDIIYRGALLHYLYLLSDNCISLAEIVIKQKNLRPPQSYHDAIDILGENKILEPLFAYEFAKIAGFRNFLAHDYEKIEIEFICKEIMSRLDDIDLFIKQIASSF
ncbi:MAG: DUF86 domain-containing protein [Nitrospirae bacterium]|nr:DUF86 domain-containing protein [Nitrospirota bacterium]